MSASPFHFAFFVKDIESTRRFYAEILGCNEGRSTETWIDFWYAGEPGTQATMFIHDLSGNALEFKSFRNPQHVFTK